MSTSSLNSFARKSGSVVVALATLASLASAEIIGPGMTIVVSDGQGNSAMYSYQATQDAQGNWSFNDNTPYPLYDNTGLLLATLNPPQLVEQGQSCAATYIADPVVGLNFAVQAGPFSPTTTFMIGSALLNHADILSGAEGRASAGFSVTDGDGNGAQLVGIGNPNGSQGGYLAQYNGYAGAVAGTTFAELHHQVDVAPDSTTVTNNNNVPVSGFTPIAGVVMDMSSFVSFTLTRNDLASGTSNFEVIPEPASLLLVLAGVAFLRRR
jgi:hypothetical protein